MELQDNLYPTIPKYARKLHSFGKERNNNEQMYSRFKFVLIDYSKGTGENSVAVDANITSEVLAYLYCMFKKAVENGSFTYSEEKIMPQNNYVKKLLIKRAQKNSKGEILRNPWSLSCEVGTGEKAYTKEGGTYLKPNTYQKERSVYVSLSDKDMFILLQEGFSRLNSFETYYGPKLLSAAQTENEAEKQIYKVVTQSALVEFIDKTDTVYNGKEYCLIGINLVDFKNNNKFVSANLSTKVLKKVFEDFKQIGANDYEYTEEKIMPNADINGMAPVTILKFVKSNKNKQGEIRKCPWYILIEQGKAKLQEFQNGAKIMQAGTYVNESRAYIALSEKDMFSALYNTERLTRNVEFLTFCREEKKRGLRE